MTAGTVDDLVLLHPNYVASDPTLSWTRRTAPLEYAPRYVRTRRMSRWHRPRYGTRFLDDGRESVTVWCGQTIPDLTTDRGRKPILTAGSVQVDDVCGTCEGRALGAGQDPTPDGLPPLTFTGNTGRPPKRCPGSRSLDLAVIMPGERCATCRACHDIVPMRVSGGPYASRWGMATHAPGEALVQPCPVHGWHHLRPWGAADAVCACRLDALR